MCTAEATSPGSAPSTSINVTALRPGAILSGSHMLVLAMCLPRRESLLKSADIVPVYLPLPARLSKGIRFVFQKQTLSRFLPVF
jgi:hypothetical protein